MASSSNTKSSNINSEGTTTNIKNDIKEGMNSARNNNGSNEVKSSGIPLGPPLDTWLLRKLLFGRLDVARTKLGGVVDYLNQAEARDKICRAIQYGSKFLSNGEAGTAQKVDISTSLARKVFRLFKFVNDLHELISPPAPGTPLPIVLLGKSKNALLSTFLFLDQIVWLHKSGIYKNKEHAEIIRGISLFCWMGSLVCTTLVEIGEIRRVSKSIKKLNKELKGTDKYKNEQYRAKIKAIIERSLALIKAAMDIVVAAGLLELAPKKITPRVTGAFGFATSLIHCYQLLPSQPKSKTA